MRSTYAQHDMLKVVFSDNERQLFRTSLRNSPHYGTLCIKLPDLSSFRVTDLWRELLEMQKR